MQKKSSTSHLTNSKDNRISIQFSLDGFSFCIKERLSEKTVYFSHYEFDTTLDSPEELLISIKEIFNTDTHLQYDFSSVDVIHQNELFAIVPEAYFDKNYLKEYLQFSIKTFSSDFISVDDILPMEAKNVFIPYININNFLFQSLGEFDYQHHISAFVKRLMNRTPTNDKKVFINVSKSSFDMVVIQGQQTLFVNSFSYATKEDFIYYILFTYEQLSLSTEEVHCYLSGTIHKESPLFLIAYTYIRSLHFLESDHEIFNQLEVASHEHYTLLGS